MIIIQDTREKRGWDFAMSQEQPLIKKRKLNAGDYTTELLEGRLIVERKASAIELVGNLGSKKHRERFYRELEKLEKIEHSYIVCEFYESQLSSFPYGSGLSRALINKMRVNGAFLCKQINQIKEEFPNVQIVFCGDRETAEEFVYQKIKRLEDDYNGERNLFTWAVE